MSEFPTLNYFWIWDKKGSCFCLCLQSLSHCCSSLAICSFRTDRLLHGVPGAATQVASPAEFFLFISILFNENKNTVPCWRSMIWMRFLYFVYTDPVFFCNADPDPSFTNLMPQYQKITGN